MNKDVGIVAKGIVLDNAIDDMIRELSATSTMGIFGTIVSAEIIWKDYQHYRPCIINSSALYNYLTFKFLTKESVMKNWHEYKNQFDDRAIHGFIDYCIMLFTNDESMKTIPEIEQRFITKKLEERIKKLNRSIQWAI